MSDHALAPAQVMVHQVWAIGPHGLRGCADRFLLNEAKASVSADRLPVMFLEGCASRRSWGHGLALTSTLAWIDCWDSVDHVHPLPIK